MLDDETRAAAPPAGESALYNFAPGILLGDRYRLRRFLGRGGFGVVWLATDEQLGMDVAIKLLSELLINNPDAVEELKLETKNSLRLTHPNIVRIHGFFQTPQAAGIVMEYVDGGTLQALKVQRERRCFDPPDVLHWVRDLCEALDYAHRRGRIVHRDLKPGNLMVDSRGELKVADFGIARTISDTYSKLSNAHPTSGTLAYMSPQQLMGQAANVTDDVYSLGATLFDLLAGKPPFFSGDVPEQIRQIRPPSMAERRRELGIEGGPIPPEWEETIAACLSKEPERRPQSAGQVAEMLGLRAAAAVSPARDSGPVNLAAAGTEEGSGSQSLRLSGPQEMSAPSVSMRAEINAEPETARRPKSRRMLWIAASAALALLAATGAMLLLRKPAPPPVPVCRLDPDRLDFGQVVRGESREASFTLLNSGGGWLEGTIGPGGESGFTVTEGGGSFRLTAGQSRTVTVRFAPHALGSLRNRLDLGLAATPGPELVGEGIAPVALQAQAAPAPAVPAQPETRRAAQEQPGRAETDRGRQAEAVRDAGPQRDAPPSSEGESPTPGESASQAEAAPPAQSIPPATPPEHPNPRSASAGPTDQDRIREVIRLYKQSFEQLDVDLYARIRPSLSSSDRGKLRDSFRDLKGQTLSIGEPSIELKGDRATAAFREKRALLLRAGKDYEMDRQVSMTLERSGAGWIIRKIEYR